ncbi:MAG TPA: CBS domain-containing protein, partial [Candidatus Cybelea sp.]|nr:CBS domain-containing protein [Candidatus Cybelea sp.]
DTPLARVCQWLRAKDIGAVVVSADGRHLLGLLSERHVIEALAHHGATAMSLKAEDVMTRAVVTCGREDSVTRIMHVMTERRIRHIPVVEDGALVGIVSIGDVVKHRLDEADLETRVLRDTYLARH